MIRDGGVLRSVEPGLKGTVNQKSSTFRSHNTDLPHDMGCQFAIWILVLFFSDLGILLFYTDVHFNLDGHNFIYTKKSVFPCNTRSN